MEICKHTDDCGGCLYQGVPYPEQLQEKEEQLQSLLTQWEVHWEKCLPIASAPAPYQYRNKMEYTFGDLVKGGEMTLGMHKKKQFMSIVTVDQCQLVHPDFNRILRAVLDFCRGQNYSFYHKKTHRGLLRNLIVRRGVRTGEILVNLVTTSQATLDGAAFVQSIAALPLENKVVGVLHTINDNPADAVNRQELHVLQGRDYYMERIMDLHFKVSAFSFFQTNVEAAERLYTFALELLSDWSGKVVFDLFCGTGTITQTLAKKAKKALGIELVPEAVAVAKENAERNGLENCHFIEGDVFKVLQQLEIRPDVLVVDPPRMGIADKALTKIAAYQTAEILYISCNPKTLVQNLAALQHQGYSVKMLKPFDNFPGTKHTECVALLSRI